MNRTSKRHTDPNPIADVEFRSYPPPKSLVKLMEYDWAKLFLTRGLMRFGSLESYRTWENKELGDPNDGNGMLRISGLPHGIRSRNPEYAWCSSLTKITPARMRILADSGRYNSLVLIRDPLTLIRRVLTAIRNKQANYLLPLCALAEYDKGEEDEKAALGGLKERFLYQKDHRFADDFEYRLLLTDARHGIQSDDHLDICVGDCSDILTIEALPT